MLKVVYFLEQHRIIAGTGDGRSTITVTLAHGYLILRFAIMHFQMIFNILLDFDLVLFVHLGDEF